MSGVQGWQRTSIGQVATVDSGPAFQSKHFCGPGEGIPLLRGDNLEPGRLRWERTRTWPEALLPGYEHLLVLPGDSILAMDRPIVSAGLKLAQVKMDDVPALLVQRVARLRAQGVDPDFLHYLLQSPQFTDQLRVNFVGTQIPHITLASIRDFQFSLPPMEEQRRVVDILEDHLSRVDVASMALHATHRHLVSLRRAAVAEITRRHAEGSVSLRSLVERIEAGRSFGSASRPAQDHEWGIVKVSAMTWGEFRPHENKVVTDIARIDSRYEIHVGDILVSRANTTAYVGAPVLVKETRARLLLSDKSLRLIPRAGVSSAYLNCVLSAPAARQQMSARATGTKDSMRNISQTALLAVEVPFASPASQAAVVAEVTDLDSASARLGDSLTHGHQRALGLRRALLEAAFSGRLTAGDAVADHIEELAGV